MNREEFLALLEKYQQGKTSSSENKRIETFFDNLQIKGVTPLLCDRKQKQLFDSIETQLPELKKYNQIRHIGLMAIASVAICLCLVFWPSTSVLDGERLTISTALTQDSLLLSDGSTIYLNQNTTIHYPKHFSDSSRQVELIKGSAFFKVARDENRPFSVISDGLTTQVLGTSFNIVNQDNSLNVTVAYGRVRVNSKDSSLHLVPNEQAILTTTGNLKKQQVNAQLYSRWMNQNVDYGSIMLSELSTVMQLRFGLPFHFQDESLKSHKVRVSILDGEDVDKVISKLNYITNYNLKINADVITVSKSN